MLYASGDYWGAQQWYSIDPATGVATVVSGSTSGYWRESRRLSDGRIVAWQGSGSEQKLRWLDPTTLVATEISASTARFWGAIFQAASGVVYCAVGQGVAGRWYTFDATTGTTTEIATTTSLSWADMVQDTLGILYAIPSVGKWYTFDPTAGTTTQITGSTSANWASAFRAESGTIYAVASTGKWYTFDPTTGAHTQISTSTTAIWSHAMQAADGTIYGFTRDGSVYTFNPTTGANTLLHANTDISFRTAFEIPPPPPPDQAESISVEYVLAMEWGEAMDGTAVCIDDGSEYDSIRSTVTLRLTPEQLQEWEAAWQGDGIVYPEGTGLLLGPGIDHSEGDVPCLLEDFRPEGPVDSTLSLYDATAVLAYGPLGTPSAGSLAYVMAHGVPYHTPRSAYLAQTDDSGTTTAAARGRSTTRTTKWYCGGLSHDEALDALNGLRTLRGSSTTWAAPISPWGPGEATSATVRIPSWTLTRASNLTWELEMEVSRV